jgi:hypothetical protein
MKQNGVLAMAREVDRDRLIAEGSTILKCNDGHWLSDEGEDLTGHVLFVVGLARGLRCFKKDDSYDELKEVPGEELPDPDELNAAIPESEWGTDLSGNPRKPWKLAHIVYLIDDKNGTSFTYLNDTAGARIAWNKLASRIRNMCALNGGNLAPFIQLDSRPMKTNYGVKMRPAFTVTDDWREISVPALPAPNGGAVLQIESKPAVPKVKSEAETNKPVIDLNDALPW